MTHAIASGGLLPTTRMKDSRRALCQVSSTLPPRNLDVDLIPQSDQGHDLFDG
ncbi:BQ5605_C023g09705 [Microbotryum silenes-dioicae]|uniref:BQ5605_C023g09705 protein n=1 Tax=Microbotryum silenes-dioicae TaxID=796604 RepID=A0A2X0N7J2_9BASI|nr:BQ5605_C023g09705 [Microbotryum silenes-dioicae]